MRTLRRLALGWLALLCACAADGGRQYRALLPSHINLLNASPLEPLTNPRMGWRDGVGIGRPWPMPMSLEKLGTKAQSQVLVAKGISILWHVAEPQMVAILRELFQANSITGIEVVLTLPRP